MKPWYLSKTIWAQVLALAAAIALQLADIIPTAAVALTGAAAVINTVIRFLTVGPIESNK